MLRFQVTVKCLGQNMNCIILYALRIKILISFVSVQFDIFWLKVSYCVRVNELLKITPINLIYFDGQNISRTESYYAWLIEIANDGVSSIGKHIVFRWRYLLQDFNINKWMHLVTLLQLKNNIKEVWIYDLLSYTHVLSIGKNPEFTFVT